MNTNANTYDNERIVLGCLILFPEDYAIKMKQMSAEFFTGTAHRTIYNALLRAYRKHGVSYDTTLVVNELLNDTSTDNELKSEIKTELMNCCDITFKSTPFDEHYKTLVAEAGKRYLQSSYEELMLDNNLTAESIRERLEVYDKAYNADSEKDYKSVYDRYLDNLTKPKQSIKTGYSKIDSLTGGLRRGTLSVIGARASTGKTALALNIALNVAKQSKKVQFFSLEMTADMILDRLACRSCWLDYKQFNDDFVGVNIKTIIKKFLDTPSVRDNMQIIDDVNTIENICNYISSIKPDLVIIDYVQIVRTLKHIDSVRLQIDYISSELKRIAKQTNCCIVLLSQLRRKDSDSVKAPTMQDLKESSGLEQNGDYILMLYRPFVDNKTDYTSDETKLIIEKNKFGRTGIINLNFDGSHQYFSEIEPKQIERK